MGALRQRLARRALRRARLRRLEPPRRPYSDAEDLAALLDYLGIERAHLVGLSLGGRIVIDFALVQPGRVASLALAGPGLAGFEFSDPESGKRFWDQVQAAQRGDRGSLPISRSRSSNRRQV